MSGVDSWYDHSRRPVHCNVCRSIIRTYKRYDEVSANHYLYLLHCTEPMADVTVWFGCYLNWLHVVGSCWFKCTRVHDVRDRLYSGACNQWKVRLVHAPILNCASVGRLLTHECDVWWLRHISLTRNFPRYASAIFYFVANIPSSWIPLLV